MNPTVTSPQRRAVVELPPQAGANDALPKTVEVVEQSDVPVEPPFQAMATAHVVAHFALCEEGEPLACIFNRVTGI